MRKMLGWKKDDKERCVQWNSSIININVYAKIKLNRDGIHYDEHNIY